ncbi:MAG: hypothetical protein ACRDZ8_14100 [Acidimicrobiales bacterium]
MADKGETVGDTLTRQSGLMARRADHAMGLELQIVELVERQTRAKVQHRDDDVERLELELNQLRAELAATADYGIARPARAPRASRQRGVAV